MAISISEVKKKILTFWEKEMQRGPSQVKVIKIDLSADGWLARVQITEENEYLKKLGHPPVFDKNIYDTTLDNAGKVIGFCKEEEREKDKEDEE